MDGLINVYDNDIQGEDDALLYTLNTECAVVSDFPVSKLYSTQPCGRFFSQSKDFVSFQNHLKWLPTPGKQEDKLAVITTEEEVQIWLADDAEPLVQVTRDDLNKLKEVCLQLHAV